MKNKLQRKTHALLSNMRKCISGRNSTPKVYRHSKSSNIYHCCVQKTASQWILQMLSDPQVHAATGLKTYYYEASLSKGHDSRKLTEKFIERPMPERTVVTPLYFSYECFIRLPKPEFYKAFFVGRDPRDIVISWYFSTKFSHVEMGSITKNRQILNELSTEEGIKFSIDHLNDYGLFDALGSWITGAKGDSNVKVVQFEELTQADNFSTFRSLFNHLDILLSDEVLADLLEKYSFARLSGGRQQGDENQMSHYRKGEPDDWKNHFDDESLKYFYNVTGSLITDLGYSDV